MDLEMFVMVKFERDGVVEPKESAWFGWWNGMRVEALEEQRVYDDLGLRQLDERGRLKRVVKESEHMVLDEKWIRELVKEYLMA